MIIIIIDMAITNEQFMAYAVHIAISYCIHRVVQFYAKRNIMHINWYSLLIVLIS